MNHIFLLKTFIYFQNQHKKLYKIMFLFNKNMWSFLKLTIMWTYNQTQIKFKKKQDLRVFIQFF